MTSDPPRLGQDASGGQHQRRAAQGGTATGVRADGLRHTVGVAMQHDNLVKWNAGSTKFLSRRATGSMRSTRAASSTIRSINRTDSGRPAPRYGPMAVVLVSTPSTWTPTLAIL